MSNQTFIKTICIIVLFLFTFQACQEKESPLPTEITSIETSTHLSSRIQDSLRITSTVTTTSFNGTIQTYGHAWSTSNPQPTLSDDRSEFTYNVLQQDTVMTIHSSLKLVTPNATHYIRPYITTTLGTVYGTTFEVKPIDPIILHLAQILQDSLSAHDIGYSFAIAQGGNEVMQGAGGPQSRVFEGIGEAPMTVSSKMQIASMTKTLTAAAFLQLAQKHNITPQTFISPYLPASWKKGPLIETLTFDDLLKHRSGFRNYNNNCNTAGNFLENRWGGLKELIEKGIQEHEKTYCYQNANYSLFRVLIPSLLGYQFINDDAIDDQETSRIYTEYITKELFNKAGVNVHEPLQNDRQQPTLGYTYPHTTNTLGFNPGSFTASPGGYGFYLSASQAGAIFSKTLSPTATILTTEMQETLLKSGYGSFATTTPIGEFYYHDGIWFVGGPRTSIQPQGFRSIWMKGPNDVTVVLFTNSLRKEDGLFPLRSAFYFDITSFILWAFYKANGIDDTKGRVEPLNFHQYLQHPEPH